MPLCLFALVRGSRGRSPWPKFRRSGAFRHAVGVSLGSEGLRVSGGLRVRGHPGRRPVAVPDSNVGLVRDDRRRGAPHGPGARGDVPARPVAHPDPGPFPRRQKFLLGDRIQTTALTGLERLVEATFTRQRGPLLERVNVDLDKLRRAAPFLEGARVSRPAAVSALRGRLRAVPRRPRGPRRVARAHRGVPRAAAALAPSPQDVRGAHVAAATILGYMLLPDGGRRLPEDNVRAILPAHPSGAAGGPGPRLPARTGHGPTTSTGCGRCFIRSSRAFRTSGTRTTTSRATRAAARACSTRTSQRWGSTSRWRTARATGASTWRCGSRKCISSSSRSWRWRGRGRRWRS